MQFLVRDLLILFTVVIATVSGIGMMVYGDSRQTKKTGLLLLLPLCLFLLWLTTDYSRGGPR